MLIPPIKREEVIPIQDKLVPRTYICATDSRFNCKTPEEGEMWYRIKFPNLPEDFYGIIARYTWGQPQTKKSIKQETKKVKKNPRKPIPQGLSCIKKKFSLSFE